jgi:23S rRNA-/tRNA-specific pseudouridylate synthase
VIHYTPISATAAAATTPTAAATTTATTTTATTADAILHALSIAKSSSEHSVLDMDKLLELRSIYYLPPNPSSNIKPLRLTQGSPELNAIIKLNSYLRIHFHPRRFPSHEIYEKSSPSIIEQNSDTGYTIIHKPNGVPVHSTVDNFTENVLYQYRRYLVRTRNRRKADDDDNKDGDGNGDNGDNADSDVNDNVNSYVALPSRLDHDTSGVMVLATNKLFGKYYSKLLRDKTKSVVCSGGADSVAADSDSDGAGGIKKTYKALLNIKTANTLPPVNTVITHYLEITKRAPKIFHSSNPDGLHQECLLVITDVSRPIYDLTDEQRISLDVSNDTVGVVEVTINLLTGRTHQIRGQLSSLNFPLTGDRQYNGGLKEYDRGSDEPLKLGLMCYSLEFCKPKLIRSGTNRYFSRAVGDFVEEDILDYETTDEKLCFTASDDTIEWRKVVNVEYKN